MFDLLDPGRLDGPNWYIRVFGPDFWTGSWFGFTKKVKKSRLDFKTSVLKTFKIQTMDRTNESGPIRVYGTVVHVYDQQ